MTISINVQQEILSTYKVHSTLYSDYASLVAELIKKLLDAHGVKTHSVVYRSKSTSSLNGKISRADKSYICLTDITDLAGARITTYFADDVNRVADILMTEFTCDPLASINKRRQDEPDRFGYQSLHYIVSLPIARSCLTEYAKFAELKCEVQVRSILQHAWAEIEHDLGYKSAAGVPIDLRRRFARIAGLLELADDEFCSIRDALNNYANSIPQRIIDEPASVDLDMPSFRALFSVPSAITALDDAVIRAGDGDLGDSSPKSFDTLIERLNSLGIFTVDELEKKSLENIKNVGDFVKYWTNGKLGSVGAGIGVFYLIYVLLWQRKDENEVLEYLNRYEMGEENERHFLAIKLIDFKPMV